MARQLEIDGSVSDRKMRRKRKQLESDGSARQLNTKTQRDLHGRILFRNGYEKGLMGSLRRQLNGRRLLWNDMVRKMKCCAIYSGLSEPTN